MTVKETRAEAVKRHEHARRCKKSPDECPVCQGNIKWFEALPTGVLNSVLCEG